MSKVPFATYRLQLNAAFTLDDAAVSASYLAELGISHVYASPYLQAAPGSTHGYDVMDPTQVNKELGGQEAYDRLCQSLACHGLGQVLDIVPNHMAISGPDNQWWWNVLENGPASPYASYFDVEWDFSESRLGNKILLPILGDHYGRVLEAGEIQLKREHELFTISYYQHKLPVAPRSLATILHRAAELADSEDLAFIADAFDALPLASATDWDSTRRRYRNLRVIRNQLRQLLMSSSEIASAIDTAVTEVNVDPDMLDALLEKQNYRIAFWRTAARELGYRRFFDINNLVGVRVEDERVMDDTHRLILEWLRKGVLDGVRIDHPDGLRDPEQYLRRLRIAAPEAWIVVEKILHPGEKLPRTWPVAGTTGYDFLNIVGGLLIDPASEQPLTEFYADFTGETTDYPALARQKKHQVMHLLMGSDINRLTELLLRICEMHRRYRDFTRFDLNEGIRELIACFPVYRTYVRVETDQVRSEDRQIITEALTAAKNFRPELDPEMFDFIGGILLRQYRGDLETEFVMRFQQVTGPVTAKGIEDTAFYCYNRFVALNEVGGDPSQFGIPPEVFHQAMSENANRQPHAMLATSTHDTKRSEDVRARLSVLSEIPDRWREAVERWSTHNERYKIEGFPDRNAEYLLYQTLVGAWPIEQARVQAYMEKAGREAKVHTSWTTPVPAYEEAVRDFISGIFQDAEFHSDVQGFVESLVWPGRVNALSQLLIKLTAPGVPDIYQGTELWNLCLVDPDNRNPVDFDLRCRLLSEVKDMDVDAVMKRFDEGLPKLWLLYQTLKARHTFAEIFASRNYQPILAQGERAAHVVAFARGDSVITVVPRFLLRLNGQWGDTHVDLPQGTWRNQLTCDAIAGNNVAVRDLLSRFPVALLVKE